MILPTLLRFLSVPLVYAESSGHLRLFHRIHHPLSPGAPFSEKGTIHASETNVVSFHPAPSLSQDWIGFAEALQAAPGSVNSALYQVALEHEGDTTEGQWDISSVKVCHLPQITSEFIYLHTSGSDDAKPHALDYFVSPVPHDGGCPKPRSKKQKLNKAGETSPFLSFDHLNTTVVLRGPRFPPLPELTTPPPLTAEGAPVVPVPEQSFLQKYWVYIVGLLVLALVSGGGGEEEQPRRSGS